MQVKKVKITKLFENPSNPRSNENAVPHVIASIKKFGWQQPVVAKPDGEIIAGHTRYKAAVKMGLKEIPVKYFEGSNIDAVGYNIADNKTSEFAEWDDDALSKLLAELQAEDALEGVGFDGDEIDELLSGMQGDGEPVDVEPEEPPVNPVSKTGDLWLLGEHRVLCGNCTVEGDVERVMDGRKFNLLLADPPYGDSWVDKAKDMNERGYGHSHAVLRGSIQSDELRGDDLKEFLCKFLNTSKTFGNAPFPLYVWHRAKRIIFEQSLIESGFHVHQPVIWVKPSFVIGRLHYHPQCEWALHGWLKAKGTCSFYGARNQSDIWIVDRENDKIHPTQKPIELFTKPLLNHTRKNEIVYDPFLGSGTTLIAAEQLNRKCHGIEIEPAYVDVIIKRWQTLTEKEATLEGTDKTFEQIKEERHGKQI